MSSGKKFSDCVYCIHYKVPDTYSPCNICECNDKGLFFNQPSQFKAYQSLMVNGTKEEYEDLKKCLRQYHNKPVLKEDTIERNDILTKRFGIPMDKINKEDRIE